MQIRSWLIGLERYADAFEELEFELADLPDLSDATLKGDLGIIIPRHRRELLAAIAQLELSTAETPAAGAWPEGLDPARSRAGRTAPGWWARGRRCPCSP